MKLILLALFIAITAFTYWLRYINLQHLKQHGSVVPEGFEGAIDAEKLRKSSAYTFASRRSACGIRSLITLCCCSFSSAV